MEVSIEESTSNMEIKTAIAIYALMWLVILSYPHTVQCIPYERTVTRYCPPGPLGHYRDRIEPDPVTGRCCIPLEIVGDSDMRLGYCWGSAEHVTWRLFPQWYYHLVLVTVVLAGLPPIALLMDNAIDLRQRYGRYTSGAILPAILLGLLALMVLVMAYISCFLCSIQVIPVA
jgi:hypothetical protein